MNRYPYDEKALEKEYPLAARCARPEGSIVAVGDVKIGPGTLTLIAGPCAVESREQLFTTAAAVKAAGAAILRGGTYKPRTSPYAFAGGGTAPFGGGRTGISHPGGERDHLGGAAAAF